MGVRRESLETLAEVPPAWTLSGVYDFWCEVHWASRMAGIWSGGRWNRAQVEGELRLCVAW